MAQAAFSTSHITKEFSGVRVLNDINLDVFPGEVLGIIGENGAGKSTLLKIISGIYQPTEGLLHLEGERVSIKNPISAKRLGISMVPQEFNLIGTLTVFENIFLGNEHKRFGLLDKARMRRKTRAMMEELHSNVNPDVLIDHLSVAEKQMVEIAKALVHDSRILIMDEPTTVLTKEEVGILFSRVRQLKAKGVSIIFISHKLGEIREICDRVMILRDGDVISMDPASAIDEPEMARRMVGRELTQIFPDKTVPQESPALEIRGMSVPGSVGGIDLLVKKGEVLGIAGLMGSGQTEMAEAVMGIRRMSAGEIVVNGETVTLHSPLDAVKHKIAYLSEDRQGKGLLLNFNIPGNITLISLRAYTRFLIDKVKERVRAGEFVDRFDIKTASLGSELQYLSGGNQQKVYLAKWMDTHPQILILNEPTRGIDVNAKSEIYHFIQRLAQNGIACIVISSELEELIGLCSRVVVMHSGVISGELTGTDINEETIMFHAAGLHQTVHDNGVAAQ